MIHIREGYAIELVDGHIVEYVVRPLALDKWLVAKFEGSKAPITAYSIRKVTEHSYRCDCFDSKKRANIFCKHAELVESVVGIPTCFTFTEFEDALDIPRTSATSTYPAGKIQRRNNIRSGIRIGSENKRTRWITGRRPKNAPKYRKSLH